MLWSNCMLLEPIFLTRRYLGIENKRINKMFKSEPWHDQHSFTLDDDGFYFILFKIYFPIGTPFKAPFVFLLLLSIRNKYSGIWTFYQTRSRLPCTNSLTRVQWSCHLDNQRPMHLIIHWFHYLSVTTS